MSKKKSVSPYTETGADQIRAAVKAVGHVEGYASITDLVQEPLEGTEAPAAQVQRRQEMARHPSRRAQTRTQDPREEMQHQKEDN